MEKKKIDFGKMNIGTGFSSKAGGNNGSEAANCYDCDDSGTGNLYESCDDSGMDCDL